MRRIVEESARNRPARRSVRALVVAPLFAIAIADRASAVDGDGPELTSPAEMPPIVSRPTTPRPTVTAPGQRAVLAVPGGMTPSNRPSAAPEPPTTPLEPVTGELSLEAPIEMRPAPAPAPSPSRARPSPGPSRSPRPLVLESTPTGDGMPLDESTASPSTRRPTARSQPLPAPVRRPRLFGLLPAPPMARASAPVAPKPATTGRSGAQDLRDDPAAESALKRRVERQAREAISDRARSVEVRVVGKDVVILARGVRFYQRRGVRKSLETLPALSGLRSVIEVAD